MGFCVNLLNVDASFEMGPRWIFLTDGPFVIISLFHYEMFSWTKLFIPAKKLSLPKRLPNRQVFWRHVKNLYKCHSIR